MTYDPRYLRGIELFNEEKFFEAHEIWEDLWHATRDASEDFIQGLIQLASALHHLQNGNLRGARLLHDSGMELLSPYGDSFMGIDLKTLRRATDDCLQEVIGAPIEALPGRGHMGTVRVEYRPELVPKIAIA